MNLPWCWFPQAVQTADFVFILDTSGSMGNNINDVAVGLSGFVTALQNAKVNGR